jgi:hypothetical protein
MKLDGMRADGLEGCLAGGSDKTILLKAALASEKVFDRIDDFRIGELMFRERPEFHGVDMGGPTVSRESDCEHDFGNQRNTHTLKFMIPNLGDRAKEACAIF